MSCCVLLAYVLSSCAGGEPTPKDAQFEKEMHEWEAGLHKVVQWKPLKIIEAVSRRGRLEALDDGSLKAPARLAEKEQYTIKATSELNEITAFRLEVLPEAGRVGRTGNAVLSEFQVRTAQPALQIAAASADFAPKGFGPMAALDGNAKTGWAFAGATGTAHAVVFELAKPLNVAGETQLTFVLSQDFSSRSLNRVRITATNAAPPVRELPESIRQTIALEPSERSPEQRSELAEYFRSTAKPALQR